MMFQTGGIDSEDGGVRTGWSIFGGSSGGDEFEMGVVGLGEVGGGVGGRYEGK